VIETCAAQYCTSKHAKPRIKTRLFTADTSWKISEGLSR
jgi:hypothetical protein